MVSAEARKRMRQRQRARRLEQRLQNQIQPGPPIEQPLAEEKAARRREKRRIQQKWRRQRKKEERNWSGHVIGISSAGAGIELASAPLSALLQNSPSGPPPTAIVNLARQSAAPERRPTLELSYGGSNDHFPPSSRPASWEVPTSHHIECQHLSDESLYPRSSSPFPNADTPSPHVRAPNHIIKRNNEVKIKHARKRDGRIYPDWFVRIHKMQKEQNRSLESLVDELDEDMSDEKSDSLYSDGISSDDEWFAYEEMRDIREERKTEYLKRQDLQSLVEFARAKKATVEEHIESLEESLQRGETFKSDCPTEFTVPLFCPEWTAIEVDRVQNDRDALEDAWCDVDFNNLDSDGTSACITFMDWSEAVPWVSERPNRPTGMYIGHIIIGEDMDEEDYELTCFKMPKRASEKIVSIGTLYRREGCGVDIQFLPEGCLKVWIPAWILRQIYSDKDIPQLNAEDEYEFYGVPHVQPERSLTPSSPRESWFERTHPHGAWAEMAWKHAAKSLNETNLIQADFACLIGSGLGFDLFGLGFGLKLI